MTGPPTFRLTAPPCTTTVFNSAECGYDEGDCCECDCGLQLESSSSNFTCGVNGFICVDPASDCFEGGEPSRARIFEPSSPDCFFFVEEVDAPTALFPYSLSGYRVDLEYFFT